MSNKTIEDIQFKRGNAAGNDAYVGPGGSITVDQEDGTIRVHDGETPGGYFRTVGRHHLTQGPDDQTSNRIVRVGDDVGVLTGFSRRNVLINGGFDIWQRGDSQSVEGYASADRWHVRAKDLTFNLTRETFALGQVDVPGNPNHYCRVDLQSSDNTADSRLHVSQRIEDVRTMSGKRATVSFWARADAHKDIAVSLTQNYGNDAEGHIGSDFHHVHRLTLSAEWKRYTIAVNVPDIGGHPVGDSSNLAILFWMHAGNNWTDRCDGAIGDLGTIDLAQVQLEEGLVPTEFESRPPGEELWLCQRYYESGYAVGRKDRHGSDSSGVVFFKATKRTDPALTVKNPVTGTAGSARATHNSTGGYNVNVFVSGSRFGENSALDSFYFGTGGHTPSDYNDFTLNVKYLADAEL